MELNTAVLFVQSYYIYCSAGICCVVSCEILLICMLLLFIFMYLVTVSLV